ncbi:MAG: hypothetical protein ACT4PW_03120 [Acidimicrobiia bacterium]
MEHEDHLTDRLRRLGTAPIEPSTAARHVAELAAVAPARRTRWTPAVAVAAALLAVAVPAAAVAFGDDSQPTDVGPAQTPEDPGPGGGELSCTGPPPFAGTEPEGDTEEEQEANRAAEAEAFEVWRAENCPADEERDDAEEGDADDEGPPEGIPPGVAEGCAGPPPFAELPAEEADPGAGVIPSPRADEARQLAEQRAACGGEDGEGDVGGTEAQAETGPPEGTPTGPPEGTPTGPPEGTPAGAPEGTPTGPPDGTPTGPPDGVPGG